MCGIAGVVNFKGVPKADVEEMISLIKYRGPDAQNIYAYGPVILGHARLRIIDLDKSADQPFFNNNKNLVVIFNGEIYNYKELKSELTSYHYKTTCDTEVILAAYEKWGQQCVHHFNGMFAFVIYDLKNQIVFGARDRFGVKPFYYSIKGKNLLFSSEIKSISSQLKSVIPNNSSIAEFLKTGYCEHKKETFFEDIFQLLPGESFVFSKKGFSLTRYYDLINKFNIIEAPNTKNIPKHFIKLLKSSLKYRVRSDVPIGLLYSGGIDSSVIASLLRQKSNNYVNSITAISDDIHDFEIKIIEKNADKFNLKHFFCNTDNHSYDLKNLMWHTEMPYGVGVLCDDILNKTAKDLGIVVLLEGNGSDEVQAGYLRYYYYFLIDLFLTKKYSLFIKNLINPPQPLNLLSTLFVLIKKIFKLKFFNKILTFNYLNKNLSIEKYFVNSFANLNSSLVPRAKIYSNSYLKNEIYKDIYTKLQRVLRIKDRISMAHSRELRSPFLDYRIFEYMCTLPDWLKIGHGKQKNVIRSACQDLILPASLNSPKNLLLKKKISKNKLNNLCEEAIKILNSQSSKKRNIFNINKLIIDFNSGKLGFDRLWRFSQVELWYQVFVDTN